MSKQMTGKQTLIETLIELHQKLTNHEYFEAGNDMVRCSECGEIIFIVENERTVTGRRNNNE